MSDRADKLLRELLAATDELEGTPIEWRIAVRIGEAQKLARAYLNEKPQPIKDADMVESGHASERLSPPSAAAEPEKPMSDDLLEAARAAVKNARPGEFVLTAREIGQLLARLDASPSAQPLLDALRKISRKSVVTEMHDIAIAAIKSAGKEST